MPPCELWNGLNGRKAWLNRFNSGRWQLTTLLTVSTNYCLITASYITHRLISNKFPYIYIYPLFTLVRGCEKKKECQFSLGNNIRLQTLTLTWKVKSTWNKRCVLSSHWSASLSYQESWATWSVPVTLSASHPLGQAWEGHGKVTKSMAQTNLCCVAALIRSLNGVPDLWLLGDALEGDALSIVASITKCVCECGAWFTTTAIIPKY